MVGTNLRFTANQLKKQVSFSKFAVTTIRDNNILEGNAKETAIEVMKHAAIGGSGRFEVHQPNHQKLAWWTLT